MKDIKVYPLLSREDERECGIRVRDSFGEEREAAIDRLVCGNLRLVVKLAHDFSGSSLSFSDLVSEGNSGLVTAAQRFDPDKGAKFSSYSAWWIKQAMRRAIAEKSKAIRVPLGSQRAIWKINRFRNEFVSVNGRDPSLEEVVDGTKLKEEKVRRLWFSANLVVSLNQVSEGEDFSLDSILADEMAIKPDMILDEKMKREQLDEIMEVLSPRERKILNLRFGLNGCFPLTLDEVGEHIGRTRERVRQIQVMALKKLKRRYSSLSCQ